LYFVPANLKTEELTLSELIDERFRFAASTSIRPLEKAEAVLRGHGDMKGLLERLNTPIEEQSSQALENAQAALRQRQRAPTHPVWWCE